MIPATMFAIFMTKAGRRRRSMHYFRSARTERWRGASSIGKARTVLCRGRDVQAVRVGTISRSRRVTAASRFMPRVEMKDEQSYPLASNASRSATRYIALARTHPRLLTPLLYAAINVSTDAC